MSLAAGTRLGPYEILTPLGAGGMGQVYRARDSTLDRGVAIKVLPESFALDADRVARFTREAKTLASLNHPNIAQIFGIETNAIVMELVEGDDLSGIIARGPIALTDALPIARQIADALEAAHEQGIIHRDLKPANVKVRPDGTVKVLDFGLAKALDANASSATAEAMNSPTLTARATQMGLILGTAAYMAPEQAKGRAVDRRADIWAFGVVLYEMLTGRRLFDAEDISETLAAVLTREVSLTSLAPDTPARLRALIRDCLIRDPRQRLRDIGDARLVLEKVMSGAPDEASAASSGARPTWGRAWLWPALALLSLGAAGTLAAVLMRQPPPAAPTVQFTVSPPEGVGFTGAAFQLSPDGRKVAYVGIEAGKRSVWVHTFETGTAQSIGSTEGAGSGDLVWSPDSQQIAFTADDALKRVSVEGGPAQTIASLANRTGTNSFGGVSWGSRDVMLVGQTVGPLLRTSATRGTLEPATELDAARGEVRHIAPSFLPDGRHFFFLALGAGALRSGLTSAVAYVGTLDSNERRPLPGIGTSMLYSSTGHVLFAREGALMAQPFDVGRLEFSGDAVPIADSVASLFGLVGRYSITSTATLAYRVAEAQTSRLVWFDRSGRRVEDAGPPGEFDDIELSRDDRFVAYERSNDIWVLDLRNGIPQRVTSDPARDADPIWSPDGKMIAFRADRDGGRLYAHAVGVVGPDRPLLPSKTRDSPASWSRDGKYLAYEAGGNIWALPMGPASKPIRVTESSPDVSHSDAQISPDGHWVAYASTEMGPPEVFIQSFPQPGAKQRVSLAGGQGPRWSRDGKELFYVSPAAIMSVKVESSGGVLGIGSPIELFQTVLPALTDDDYDISSTGRFLMNSPESELLGITVVLNWARRVKP